MNIDNSSNKVNLYQSWADEIDLLKFKEWIEVKIAEGNTTAILDLNYGYYKEVEDINFIVTKPKSNES